MSKLNLKKLNKMYDDGKNVVYDLRGTDYSIFKSSHKKYVLDENIVFGKDYPSGVVDMDIFHVLDMMKDGIPLDEVLDNYRIRSSFNLEMFKGILKSQGFVNESDLDLNPDDVGDLSASQLADILKKMGIPAFGKRKKLLKLVLDNLSQKEVGSGEYDLTEEGEKFLKDFQWVDIYDYCLDYFEFDDFYKFFDEHDGEDYTKLTLDYLDEHIKQAHEKQDFLYFNDCCDSKVMFYLYDENFKEVLNEELKNFICRLNPFYDYSDVYREFNVFEYEAIDNINECFTQLPDVDIEKLFYEIWEDMDISKEFISKEDGFKILERLLNEESIFDISDEYKDYLGIKG